MCILDHTQSTFFCLGKFMKKSADDQCSSITKWRIYYIKHMYIQPLSWKWIDQIFDGKWKYLLWFIFAHKHLKKRKSALVWGVLIPNLVIVPWHNWHKLFVEFFNLHFDTSFSSRDKKLTTFDTDLWEMVLIQKLQIKKISHGYN